LKDESFVVLAVATDSGGPAAVAQWIRAAQPSYPCLVDEWHLVAGLYGMVNVPTAVWIDEGGRIVRPSEAAGASDAWRGIDRETLTLGEAAAAAGQQARERYLAAIAQWVRTGAYALAPDEARRRLREPRKEDALAAAHFRLAQHLHRTGAHEAARRHFDEASRLRPDSWSYRRQAWALAEEETGEGTPLSAAGRFAGEFWAAVDALGGRPFYPPPQLDPPPPGASRRPT
jgi:tetratricopeptide (TPR) repeat protein